MGHTLNSYAAFEWKAGKNGLTGYCTVSPQKIKRDRMANRKFWSGKKWSVESFDSGVWEMFGGPQGSMRRDLCGGKRLDLSLLTTWLEETDFWIQGEPVPQALGCSEEKRPACGSDTGIGLFCSLQSTITRHLPNQLHQVGLQPAAPGLAQSPSHCEYIFISVSYPFQPLTLHLTPLKYVIICLLICCLLIFGSWTGTPPL